MFDQTSCDPETVITYIFAISICLAGIVSYFPQYYSMIKSEQIKGISEISLLIMNIAGATLAANAFILNYWRFHCYDTCSFWICTGRLLSLLQIFIGWIVVVPLYFIFIRFKIKGSQKRILSDIRYIMTYLIFVGIMILIGLVDKALDSNSAIFFRVAATILGILAAICSAIIWIPQIVRLIKTQNPQGLSLLMFFLQTPGNIMIIILQILYKQDWTTWIAYLVLFVEQLTIIIILLILKWRTRNVEPIILDVSG